MKTIITILAVNLMLISNAQQLKYEISTGLIKDETNTSITSIDYCSSLSIVIPSDIGTTDNLTVNYTDDLTSTSNDLIITSQSLNLGLYTVFCEISFTNFAQFQNEGSGVITISYQGNQTTLITNNINSLDIVNVPEIIKIKNSHLNFRPNLFGAQNYQPYLTMARSYITGDTTFTNADANMFLEAGSMGVYEITYTSIEGCVNRKNLEVQRKWKGTFNGNPNGRFVVKEDEVNFFGILFKVIRYSDGTTETIKKVNL